MSKENNTCEREGKDHPFPRVLTVGKTYQKHHPIFHSRVSHIFPPVLSQITTLENKPGAEKFSISSLAQCFFSRPHSHTLKLAPFCSAPLLPYLLSSPLPFHHYMALISVTSLKVNEHYGPKVDIWNRMRRKTPKGDISTERVVVLIKGTS